MAKKIIAKEKVAVESEPSKTDAAILKRMIEKESQPLK